MKKIGIFYGSATGTTAKIAERIASMLGVEQKDVFDVADTAPSSVGNYELLVLGTSTWGDGEMEDDWFDFIAALEEMDLRGKKIALFGCGDETMDDSFCSGVGELYERLQKTGADFIAPYDTIGYTFSTSKAKPAESLEAVGLLLDEVNHPELTAPRLAGWTGRVLKEAE